MAQTPINIKAQMAFLMSNGKWKNCQKKQYSVFAYQAPAGYCFANKYEQPEQYRYIREKFRRNIVKIDKLDDSDKQFLGSNCYVTDGKSVVVCGVRCELTMMDGSEFVAEFTEMDGSKITAAPKQWKEYLSPAESEPKAKGMVLDTQYLGAFEMKRGRRNVTFMLNDPRVPEHYKGDILMVSMDGKSAKVVNNAVFSLTYNLIVGGWAQSKLIIPNEDMQNSEGVKPVKAPTLDEVKRYCAFDISGTVASNGDKTNATWMVTVKYVKVVIKDGKELKAPLGYLISNGQSEKKVDKEGLLAEIAKGNVKNARNQVYNGRDIIRLADGTYREEVVKDETPAPVEKKEPVNSDAPISVKAVYKEGGAVRSWLITNGEKDIAVSKEKLIEYIDAKKVSNAWAQRYNGRIIIRPKNKKEPFPIIDLKQATAGDAAKADANVNFSITTVYKLNGDIDHYTVLGSNGVSSDYKSEDAEFIQLLNNKKIANAHIRVLGGKNIICPKAGTYKLIDLGGTGKRGRTPKGEKPETVKASAVSDKDKAFTAEHVAEILTAYLSKQFGGATSNFSIENSNVVPSTVMINARSGKVTIAPERQIVITTKIPALEQYQAYHDIDYKILMSIGKKKGSKGTGICVGVIARYSRVLNGKDDKTRIIYQAPYVFKNDEAQLHRIAEAVAKGLTKLENIVNEACEKEAKAVAKVSGPGIAFVYKNGQRVDHYEVTNPDGDGDLLSYGPKDAEFLARLNNKEFWNARLQVYAGRNIVRIKNGTAIEYDIKDLAESERKHDADDKAREFVRDVEERPLLVLVGDWEPSYLETAEDSEILLAGVCARFRDNYSNGSYSKIAGVAVAATAVFTAICHDKNIYDEVVAAGKRLRVERGAYKNLMNPRYSTSEFNYYVKGGSKYKAAAWVEERDDDHRFNLFSRNTHESITLCMASHNRFGVMKLDENNVPTAESMDAAEARFNVMCDMSDAILKCIDRVTTDKPAELFKEIVSTVPGLLEIVDETSGAYMRFVQSVGKRLNEATIGYGIVSGNAKAFGRDNTRGYIEAVDKVIQAVFAQKKLSMAYFPKMVQTDSESGLSTMIFPYKTDIDYEISIDYSSGNGYDIKLFNQDKPIGSNVVDARKIHETDARGKKLNTPIDVINKLYGMLSVWFDKLL